MPRPRKYDYEYDYPAKIALYLRLPSFILTTLEKDFKMDAGDMAKLCEEFLTDYAEKNNSSRTDDLRKFFQIYDYSYPIKIVLYMKLPIVILAKLEELKYDAGDMAMICQEFLIEYVKKKINYDDIKL